MIVEKLGPLLYKVKVDSKIWKRHIDQMLASNEHTATKSDDDGFDMLFACDAVGSSDTFTTISNDSDVTAASATPRYPQQERHSPIHFGPSEIQGGRIVVYAHDRPNIR